MTRISPPESWALPDKAVEQIDGFGWIVFTSVNSVDHFMQRLYRTGDVRALGACACAVGPSTRDRLLRYGLEATSCPAISARKASSRRWRRRRPSTECACWCRVPMSDASGWWKR
jgi:uroporphyrinogen III methyltransferase/synthase